MSVTKILTSVTATPNVATQKDPTGANAKQITLETDTTVQVSLFFLKKKTLSISNLKKRNNMFYFKGDLWIVLL